MNVNGKCQKHLSYMSSAPGREFESEAPVVEALDRVITKQRTKIIQFLVAP